MNTRFLSNHADAIAPWGLTFLRVALGVIMVMHGWQKLVVNGLGATADGFASMGIPFADISAVLAVSTELVAGTALIFGLATRVSALLLGFTMVVAWITAHTGSGFFAANGGYEYVLLLVVGCLTVALTGPGAAALDSALVARPASRQDAVRPRPNRWVDAHS